MKDTNRIIELYQRGKSLKEIGEEVGLHYTTVYYYLRKSPDYVFSDHCRPKVPEEEIKRRVEAMEKGVCSICGKKKPTGWAKTNYCGIECWEMALTKLQRPSKFKLEHWDKK